MDDVASVLFLLPVVALAQSGNDTQVARTPWGGPDLQGILTSATFIPLQRPANLFGKEFLTEEETTELTQLLTAEGVDPLATNVLAQDEERMRERVSQSQDSNHYDNAIWLTESRPKGLSSSRTSLIVDPPDGRIPGMTPKAMALNGVKRETVKVFGLDKEFEV